MNWREFPFLKIFPAFFLGILAAAKVFPEGSTPVLLLVLAICAAGGALVSGVGPFVRRNPWPFCIWAMLAFFLMGSWRYQSTNTYPDAQHFSQASGKTVHLLVLVEEVRKGSKVFTVTARARAMTDTTGGALPLRGKMLLFLRMGTGKRPMAGNLLRVTGRVEQMLDNPNPGAFNYAAYLRGRRIRYNMYVGKEDWQILRQKGSTYSENLLFACRHYCLQQLKAALPGAKEYAIGAALLIGNREEMDPGVRDIFSQTGAMHILAVSGLHVGMVAWFLGWMLRWVPQRRKWVKGIVEVAGIWAYTLLCGLGASVVRAALMFSWLNLGKALGRPANIWNTLGGAAFFLLLYEPLWIFDIGFQLSFLAVAGILLFEPPLYRLLIFRNRLADYFWKLTAVGIAAQLATAPLGIYYFHQFPLFFWLSGWLAVPLGALCQGAGALYLLLGQIPALGELLGWVLQVLIKGLYWGIYGIGQIPGACLEGLWLSEWGAWCTCFILGIGAWIFFLPGKKAVWLWVALLFIASVLELRRDWLSYRRSEVVCYGINDASALEFWQGRTVAGFYSGDTARISSQTSVFHLRNQGKEVFRFSVFDSAQQERPLFMHRGPYIVAGNHRYFVWDGSQKFKGLPPKDADYWIICNNPFLPNSLPVERMPRKKVIIDGSNSRGRLRFYKQYFDKKGIPIHFTMEGGAWIL